MLWGAELLCSVPTARPHAGCEQYGFPDGWMDLDDVGLSDSAIATDKYLTNKLFN